MAGEVCDIFAGFLSLQILENDFLARHCTPIININARCTVLHLQVFLESGGELFLARDGAASAAAAAARQALAPAAQAPAPAPAAHHHLQYHHQRQHHQHQQCSTTTNTGTRSASNSDAVGHLNTFVTSNKMMQKVSAPSKHRTLTPNQHTAVPGNQAFPILRCMTALHPELPARLRYSGGGRHLTKYKTVLCMFRETLFAFCGKYGYVEIRIFGFPALRQSGFLDICFQNET